MGKLFWFVLGAVSTVDAGIAAVLWKENKLTGRMTLKFPTRPVMQNRMKRKLAGKKMARNK